MKTLVAREQKRKKWGLLPVVTILFACFASLVINWSVVLEMNKRIEAKVTEESYRDLQQMSALFADQISNSMNSVDATLRMSSHLLSEGDNHLTTLIQKKVISLEPLVLLTYVDHNGRVIETNLGPGEAGLDLSDRESVRAHLDNNLDGLFIGKPLMGRISQSWVFHLSRKVSNPDGSLRGVLIASVNPYYFACFWDDLLKGDQATSLDASVSLYGFDGVIRTGSRHLERYLANLSPQKAVLAAANTGLSARFKLESSTGLRDSHFTKMMDKPLIAVASYSSEGIAAKVAQQQEEPIIIGALISAIILATGTILLVALKTARMNEKRASAAEVRLASALDVIKDSFAIYDSEGRLTAHNKAFSASFNRSGGAQDLTAINTYLQNNRGSSHSSIIEGLKQRAIADGRMVAPERQNEINVGDGRWLRVESTATPIGETVVYGSDISESRRREAALLQRTRQVEAQAQKLKELAEIAERAAKVKSSFLAAMSHEIRTPLNAINGFAQVLGKTDMSEEPRHISKLINQSCRHLLEIVDDILDFTRLDADRVTLHPSRIDLRRLMNELIETTTILTKDKPVEAGFYMGPEAPTHIHADMRRLKQVLLNLLSNSSKFTHAGEICLIAFMVGDRIRFEVSDTGEGISPAVGETIFDPFEQGAFATRLRSSGTGLGLAISRRLVTLMGGSLGYTSKLGEGTTFHVEIPYVASVSAEPDTPSVPDIQAPLAPLRILIAEDAPSSRMLLRLLLTRQGHEVLDVDNGKKALDALLAADYDLAILDVQMPVMGGMEAAELLRACPGSVADLPMIALTAQVLDEEVERVKASGFNMVLGKPFMEEDLEAAIRSVLRRKPGRSQPSVAVAAGLHSTAAPELVHEKDA